MSAARTAVVILTKDGEEHLARGLDAVLSQRPPRGDFDVVLVDNGSARPVSGPVPSHPRLRVLRSERNLGFSGGVRLAVEAVGAEILVLLNDDAVAEPDAIASLVDALETAPPDVAAAAAMLTDPSGERVDFVEGVVTFDGHALQRGFGRPVAAARVGTAGDPRLFACGGFCAVRRRLFEALGGFDTDFFAYLEDVDFGWRATLAGHPTLFVPEARARHLSGATGRRLGMTQRGVLIEANAFATAFKNLADETLRALLPAILAAFQHRAFRGLVDHQDGAGQALADPFSRRPPWKPRSDSPREAAPSRRQAVVHWLSRLAGVSPPRTPLAPGPGQPLYVEDERSRMWLVAWNRIVSSWPLLAEKRRRVQSLRRVPDSEILERYPLHLVPTYPGDAELFGSEFFRGLLPDAPRLRTATLEEIARG